MRLRAQDCCAVLGFVIGARAQEDTGLGNDGTIESSMTHPALEGPGFPDMRHPYKRRLSRAAEVVAH